MNKIEAAEDFLESLKDPQETTNIMFDRMDAATVFLINNYAELIASVKDRTGLSNAEVISCSMIIGYLLKGQIDRHELTEKLAMA